jgi:hypothetical protein
MTEGVPGKYEAPVVTIDVSEGWDTKSISDIFLSEIRKLPFYKSDLQYSGFNADDIGVTTTSKMSKGKVFCGDESDILASNSPRHGGVEIDPVGWALDEYDRPAVAIYDPAKLKRDPLGEHEILEPRALVAVVRLKMHKE